MTDETTNPDEYQGWHNRETWACNLWLSNDEGLYNLCLEATERGVGRAEGTAYTYSLEPHPEGFVAEELKALLDDMLHEDDDLDPEAARSVAADIGSLWRIDWEEIAESFLTSYREGERAEA